MKPKWKHAPIWANYLAVDCDGKWMWYEYEPFVFDEFCCVWRAQRGLRGTPVALEKRP